MTNFLFFGDSITYGEYDGVYGGWVDILKRFYHSEYNNKKINEVNIFNLGIGGETTFGLLKRLIVEVEARKSPNGNLIFISYGANDLAYIGGVQKVVPNQFKNNLRKAISIAQKFTDKIYLLSILPISDSINGIETSTGKIRSNENIIKFNKIIKEVSSNNSIIYIDLYSAFLDNKEELLSDDGVHPNEKGYLLISSFVKQYMKM